jgi:hypothetical protein
MRVRAAIACSGCKSKKSKCSDFRPCTNCVSLGRSCQETSAAAAKKTSSVYNYPTFSDTSHFDAQGISLNDARTKSYSTDRRFPSHFQTAQMTSSKQPATSAKISRQYSPAIVDIRNAPSLSRFCFPAMMMNSTTSIHHLPPMTTSSLPPLPPVSAIPLNVAALLLQAPTLSPPLSLPPALHQLLSFSTPRPVVRF